MEMKGLNKQKESWSAINNIRYRGIQDQEH